MIRELVDAKSARGLLKQNNSEMVFTGYLEAANDL